MLCVLLPGKAQADLPIFTNSIWGIPEDEGVWWSVNDTQIKIHSKAELEAMCLAKQQEIYQSPSLSCGVYWPVVGPSRNSTNEWRMYCLVDNYHCGDKTLALLPFYTIKSCPFNYHRYTPNPYTSWDPESPNACILSNLSPLKNLGTCSCLSQPTLGHPINIGTGNKYLQETDYATPLGSQLSLSRQYNSDAGITGGIGANWRVLSTLYLLNTSTMLANRADHKVLVFNWIGGQWVPDADVSDRLTTLKDAGGNTTGWDLRTRDDVVERYNTGGAMVLRKFRSGLELSVDRPANGITIADPLGRAIALSFNTGGMLSSLMDLAGNLTTYAHDSNSNLASVTYPDGSIRQYHYEHATFKNALTGITDERGVRYITYSYDAEGKAVGEVLAGGVESYGLAFGTNQTTVTDPLGTQRTYNFQTVLGVVKNTGVSQPGGSGCGPAAEALNYDANGNISSKTDFNGRKTTYAYDLTRNLEISRTEGLSSAGAALPETRTITTSWHPTWRLPVQVNEYAGASATGNPLRRTQTAYDDKGNVTSRSVTDVAAGMTRTWTTAYTYSVAVPGLILQTVEDGPRTDVTDTTVTDYYPHDEVCAGAGLGTGRDKGCRGQVKRVTNPLGQATQFTRYNAHGQVEEIIDPNGVVTTLTYDLRQRLTSRSTAGETTAFQYDPVGQLTRLTQPDGSHIAYTYDGARRLTEVADNLGNRIVYTLDAAGNRTKEDILDPQGALAKTLTRAYDALGRMQTLTGVVN